MTRARRADRTENGAAVISNAGFSLIEIIVVVLIIAIAAGAAIMSLSAALRANTTRAATEHVDISGVRRHRHRRSLMLG